MKFKQNIYILVFAVAIFFSACSSDNTKPGKEYMPDMAHSIAYEANVHTYYEHNTWEEASVNQGSGKTLLELSSPRKPVNGTIARGYAGKGESYNTSTTNGSVPYYYEDTEPERERAIREIINNPYPITEAGLASGKNLYNIFCATCHGEKADGNGYLVRDDGGKYPAQPANLISEDFTAASNGRFYHSIMYGKNVMGGYSDKMSYEERWNVIHYIRSLQAKETKTQYTHLVNTLNSSAVPGGSKPVVAQAMDTQDEDHDGHHGEDHHDVDHSEGSDHHEGHDDGDHSHDH